MIEENLNFDLNLDNLIGQAAGLILIYKCVLEIATSNIKITNSENNEQFPLYY